MRLFSVILPITVFCSLGFGQWNSGSIILDGNNLESSYVNSGFYSIAWDSTYLYLVKKNHTTTEPVILYLDYNEIYSVVAGGNDLGSLSGRTDWSITPELPFRADFRLYWEHNYAEYSRKDSSGGWTNNIAFASTEYAFNSSFNNDREIRIAWDSMGLSVMPSTLRFFAYCTSRGSGTVFHPLPSDNPSGTFFTPDCQYYFESTNTSPTGTDNPFNNKSYTYLGTGGAIGQLTDLVNFTHYKNLTINLSDSLNVEGNLILDGDGAKLEFDASTDSLLVGDSISILNGQLLLESSTSGVIVGKGVHNYDTFIGSSNQASTVAVKGDFNNNGLFNPESTKFVFNRNATIQTISGDLDSSNAFTRLEVDNPDGIANNTNDTLIVRDTLFLTNGIIQNDSFVLIRNNGVIVPDTGKPTSYIEGRLLREVYDSIEVVFPVGTRTEYAPFTVDPDTLHSGRIYQVHYVDSMHPDALDIAPSTLDRVSFVEYWQLNELSGATSTERACQVGMYWRTYSEVSPTTSDWDSLRACFYSASLQWDTIDNNPTVTGYGQNWGKIKSTGLTSTFTPITIGSNTANNPLPVSLLFFEAESLNAYENRITWQTASEWNCKAFELYRQTEQDKEYLELFECSESSSSIKEYHFIHRNPNKQEVYWLKQVDFDGKATWYGPKIAVKNQKTSVYPNPAKNVIHLSSKNDIVFVEMVDAYGKRINVRRYSPNMLDVSSLRSGVYHLTLGFKTEKPFHSSIIIAR